ncbi:kinase-like domain-containing protein [Diaporthe sp. PMI_573]|nr:kinase-like domain-containing protein [Diaporthaceae sp. PMI_573]
MAAPIQDSVRTVDSGGAETNPFNESHFDRLLKQGIIKSSPSGVAGIVDAFRTGDTDGAETNAFNESHFDRLQQQGIKLGVQPQDDMPDRCHDAIPQKIPLHQLVLERAPQLRVLFQQPEGDTHITLAAEQPAEVHFEAPGEPNVLGAMQSRADISWSCSARRIKITMFPIPWKEDVLIKNETNNSLFLEYGPDGLDAFEIRPRQYGVIYPGSWQLRDDKTTLEFLLRPRRYRLLLKDQVTKRATEHPIPSSKRSKPSSGVVLREATESPLLQDRTTTVRPAVVDVDVLVSSGFGENQTLNMVNSATGQLEYSIKCIDRYLKRGDYADVFKAVWTDVSSQPAVVAVKIHKIAVAAEANDIAAAASRWKRELEVHRYLEHPCIPNLLAFDSRLLALIIEHRDSHDLATPQWCFPSGPNVYHFKGSINDACHILADVSSALAYFADQSLVHNDIKAGNILYRAADPTGSGHKASAVVIDFGLSRNVKTQLDDSGGGSPWYLAPEWLTDGRRGPPADVFSLGVVMLYLLRYITLPDKGRGWNVNAIQQHAPGATTSMTAWLAHVRRQRDQLHAAGANSKETKLRSLVRLMLLDEDSRISACDLAKQTVEWAS